MMPSDNSESNDVNNAVIFSNKRNLISVKNYPVVSAIKSS